LSNTHGERKVFALLSPLFTRGLEAMIIKTLRKTIKTYRLFAKGDKILLAYSGGLDSTGLLALLLEIKDEWDLKLFLGHFNHGIRQSAETDEEFVKHMADKFSIPLYLGRADVRSYSRQKRINLEEAGRVLRYDFLKKTALEIGNAKIATAHTLNDQAETFLMRLFRGSGPSGLASIYPVVDDIIVRPLIHIERKEIEDYLKKKGMSFCVDESNFDRRFFRNRIRLDLIPYLQTHFDSKIIPHLGRAASIIQEEELAFKKIAEDEAKRITKCSDETLRLDYEALLSMPRGLARRVVREFISRIKGDLRGITFQDIESILSLREGKEIHLKKQLIIQKSQNMLSLKMDIPSVTPYEYKWDGKSQLKIKEVGMVFEGHIQKKSELIPFSYDDKKVAYVDFRKIKFPLKVRNRRKGDRHQPLGSPGHKKIKEIMRAKNIPFRERDKIPLFLSGNEIVWILGLPVSEKARVDDKTERVFVIRKVTDNDSSISQKREEPTVDG